MKNRNELKNAWLSQTFSTSMPVRKEYNAFYNKK